MEALEGRGKISSVLKGRERNGLKSEFGKFTLYCLLAETKPEWVWQCTHISLGRGCMWERARSLAWVHAFLKLQSPRGECCHCQSPLPFPFCLLQWGRGGTEKVTTPWAVQKQALWPGPVPISWWVQSSGRNLHWPRCELRALCMYGTAKVVLGAWGVHPLFPIPGYAGYFNSL